MEDDPSSADLTAVGGRAGVIINIAAFAGSDEVAGSASTAVAD